MTQASAIPGHPALPPESLGLGAQPGQAHYRAYVGPPEDYDLVAAMTFGLLAALGLRQQHRVLDIGCGSLRVGRLLIPYLNRGGYHGLEPNEWLVRDGIAREVGNDQIQIKQPRFIFAESARELIDDGSRYDYLVAQSIFSHCGKDLLEDWLAQAAILLSETGALVATYIDAASDTERTGWIYPDCVSFTEATVQSLAQAHGLEFVPLEWHHPRQRWALFAKPGFDANWYRGRTLSWNDCFERLDVRRQSVVTAS